MKLWWQGWKIALNDLADLRKRVETMEKLTAEIMETRLTLLQEIARLHELQRHQPKSDTIRTRNMREFRAATQLEE